MKKLLARLLAALVALSAPVNAGQVGSAGGANRYFIPDASEVYYTCNGSWTCNGPYLDTGPKTQHNVAINTSVANLVLFVMGQSNNENEAPSQYTPTNGSAIDDFDIYNGSLYVAADPHLGTSYGFQSSLGPALMDFRAADTLITNGKFARVILVPMAIGGSLVAQWATGGPFQDTACVAMRRLADRGIVPGMTNVTFAVDWGQGEGDGTTGTTQAQYQASLLSIVTNLNACGFIGRFFVNVETWQGGAVSATIEAAQAAVVGTVIGNVSVVAGANLDVMNNTYRIDTTHFNDTGAANGASLKVSAWAASGAPF